MSTREITKEKCPYCGGTAKHINTFHDINKFGDYIHIYVYICDRCNRRHNLKLLA